MAFTAARAAQSVSFSNCLGIARSFWGNSPIYVLTRSAARRSKKGRT
jgi:hypothetical protein